MTPVHSTREGAIWSVFSTPDAVPSREMAVGPMAGALLPHAVATNAANATAAE